MPLILAQFARIWRLLDEERFRSRNLPGYTEYRKRVNYRLVPYVRSLRVINPGAGRRRDP